MLKDTEIKDTRTTNFIPESSLPFESRKSSTSENLSWIKDISSSSPTTVRTINSFNDFSPNENLVRCGNKIPVLRLSQIDNKWINQQAENDDYTSSSDSENSDKVTTVTSSDRDSPRSLDLSSESSLTSYGHQDSYQSSATKDKICKNALEKISSNLKKIDLDFLNWIGHENRNDDPEIKLLQNKVFKNLKEENDTILLCRHIKRMFKPNESSPDITAAECNLTEHHNDLIERAANNSIDKSEDDEFTSSRSRYVMFDQNCLEEEDPLQQPTVATENSECEDNFTSDKVLSNDMRYTKFEETRYNDDDDALSLFAESLTAIDSSRLNSFAPISGAVSQHEEYVPEPLTRDIGTYETRVYQPTKIKYQPVHNSTRIVCEKQNADSTYRETDSDVAHRSEVQNENFKLPVRPTNFTTRPIVTQTKLPSVFDTKYGSNSTTRSIIFGRICIFNLTSNCKKTPCMFPHVQISETEVKHRLSNLTDIMFFYEYLIIRLWPTLRRKFGILYVEECERRKLTATLLEMTIDFIATAKFNYAVDSTLKVNVLERTLLHLNTTALNDYSILLQYKFASGVLLCDVLMHSIAITQNFSQFKLVFIKLSYYIIGIGKMFRVDDASLILERLCILPPETPLALALLKIIKNTDHSIFNNSMIERFEKQLMELDENLYEELISYKKRVLKNPYTSQDLSQEGDLVSLPLADRANRYTSPDTTKLDVVSV